MSAPATSWARAAKVLRVIDGDTVDVAIDLGFHITKTERLRLLGIDAPEMKGATREAGLAAQKFLEVLIGGEAVIVETVRDRTDKYGRYLATLWVEETCVNATMIETGHAVEMSA